MSQLPPPPSQPPASQPPMPPMPGPGQGPPGGAGQRPGVITAVAWLEFIVAGFGILFGLIFLAGGGILAGASSEDTSGAAGLVGGVLIIVALVLLVVAALQIYAGVLVLKLRERGRILALVLAIISAVLQLLSLKNSATTSIGILAIDGFIIWATVSNKQYFTREGRR